MPKIEWRYIKTSISEENIVDIENKTGFDFPEDYVKIVIKFNGARPKPNRFNTNNSMDRVFKNLVSLNPDDPGNFFLVLEWIGNRIKRSMVPIAEDPSGNYLCYDFSKSNPTIVFWDNENNTTEYVSSSFDELLNQLH